MNSRSRSILHLVFGAVLVLGSLQGAIAGNSEEDALKRIQQAKFNWFSGNWQVQLKEDIRIVEDGVKNYLPGLDYVLVDEDIQSSDEVRLIYRGKGDVKVVVKLRGYDSFTNLAIKVGARGNESKSAQLFSYIYRKM